WSANGGSTYQRMKRRRKSFSVPALPTTGRSAEIAHIRSAWSRTESLTCAGGTSACAGPPARTSSLRRSYSAATSVRSSGTGKSLWRGRYGAVSPRSGDVRKTHRLRRREEGVVQLRQPRVRGRELEDVRLAVVHEAVRDDDELLARALAHVAEAAVG